MSQFDSLDPDYQITDAEKVKSKIKGEKGN